MILEFLQYSRGSKVTAVFRHLGAFGLFLFAIVDSSPLPGFGGPDILIAVLAGSHRHPWWEYAVAATLGSLIGADITYRLARKVGPAYLQHKFEHRKIPWFVRMFERWETSALVISTAAPLPIPTSAFFAAAGASNYPHGKYLAAVALCRGARYTAIAILADYVGRRFVHVLRHPGQYWPWLLLVAAIVAGVFGMTMLLRRRVERRYGETSATDLHG